jgi:hypothetical protein
MTRARADITWETIAPLLPQEITCAPKTCGDPAMPDAIRQVRSDIVYYLRDNVLPFSWGPHFALLVGILRGQNLDQNTIRGSLVSLNRGIRDLFQHYRLQHFRDWHPETMIPAYLKGECFPEHTRSRRLRFWIHYNLTSRMMDRWLRSLPPEQQGFYQSWVVPRLDPVHVQGLVSHTALKTEQQERRKAATAAIVPHFAEMRYQAHLRFNQVSRLLAAVNEVLAQTAHLTSNDLPHEFWYDDAGERYFFRLWDRRSFALAHAYGQVAKRAARNKRGAYSDEKNERFVEFVRAERIDTQEPTDGFWFIDLYRRQLVGQLGSRFKGDDVDRAISWLQQWGYMPPPAQPGTRREEDSAAALTIQESIGDEMPAEWDDGDGVCEEGDTRVAGMPSPFHTGLAGLLSWGLEENAKFIAIASDKATGVLFPVQTIYDACMVGLLALNLFTTTGMRVNEAMQIRLSDDCFFKYITRPAPEAQDQRRRVRYGFRLIPKGQRADQPADYFIGQETYRLLVKMAHMLERHYDLQPGDKLPEVSFTRRSGRHHRFANARYLFQYNGQQIDRVAITACMRFLVHGIVFEAEDGSIVVVSAHLLRHAFATYAAHVGKLPLDVIGIMLKHKNPYVTEYYSRPTNEIVAEWADPFLDRLAAHLSEEGILAREPPALRAQYERAVEQVGTLFDVLGGDCTLHGICPIQFACIGCAANVPDPRKRHQVERELARCQERIAECLADNRVHEAERWRQHQRRCLVVLKEMDLLESYQQDEERRVTIHLEPRERV